MKSFVVLSDMQIPYQDKLTLKAVDNFLEDFQPEEIYYDGDILDFPGLSPYPIASVDSWFHESPSSFLKKKRFHVDDFFVFVRIHLFLYFLKFIFYVL